MKCTKCGNAETYVVDSRKAESNTGVEVVRRRRECSACKHRFSTNEAAVEVFAMLNKLTTHLRKLVNNVDTLQTEISQLENVTLTKQRLN